MVSETWHRERLSSLRYVCYERNTNLVLLNKVAQHLGHLLDDVVEDFLSLLLESIERVLRSSNWNLVLSRGQLGPGRLDVVVQRHAHGVAVLHVWLVLGVVKLGLNRRREELDDLDIAWTGLELFSQGEKV